jgi:hypothetical protein
MCDVRGRGARVSFTEGQWAIRLRTGFFVINNEQPLVMPSGIGEAHGSYVYERIQRGDVSFCKLGMI